MNGAYCLWYCYCQRDPIARAEAVTDPRAQRIAAAHARGEHDHKEAKP